MKALLLIFLSSLTTGTNEQASRNEITSHREYLGSVKDTQGKSIFHVVNHSYKIPAAQIMHGHSEIRFYNCKWELVETYVLDEPGSLPLLLHRNTLYFQAKDAAGRMVRSHQAISVKALPKCICVEPNGSDCYFKQKS
jgi:hypothetical protein